MNFATLQGLTIPEGNVVEITDASGRVLWAGNITRLQVAKQTHDTYAGETTYTAEEFILLDIYPKPYGTVKVTYGGLTKTITDTSGATAPNAQQVFFGTFNGVSDEIATATSGTLIIEGDCAGFGTGTYKQPGALSKLASWHCACITAVNAWGGVTRIPPYALYECAGNIPSLPRGITGSIGNYAFYNCINLNSVILNEGVTSIGSSAFQGCSSLTSVTILDGVISIGDSAFGGCTNLTSVTIPNSVRSIGTSAFNGCDSLAAYISDIAAWCAISFSSEESNPGTLYLNGERLTNLVIPDGVTSIGNYAFKSCAGLTSVTIPDSVTSIGDYAFRYCSNITSITIPDSVTNIGKYAFYNCRKIELYHWPNSLTYIGDYAFYECYYVDVRNLPSNITYIGDHAFYISANTSLEGLAMYGATITIPSTVTNIGGDAFSSGHGYSGMKFTYIGGVVMLSENPPTIGERVFGTGHINSNQYITITVPKGCGEVYKTAEGWTTYADLIVEAS